MEEIFSITKKIHGSVDNAKKGKMTGNLLVAVYLIVIVDLLTVECVV